MRVPGGSYFFTVNLFNRRLSLLTDHIQLLRQAFADIQQTLPFHIDAIVILPDHLHTIMTLPVGNSDYSTRWNQIKGAFSKAIPSGESVSRSRVRKRERAIWQRRFWEHTLKDDDDFNNHVDYIHFNPVKHGYVGRPIDWPFSSIHRYVKDGTLTPDWGTLELPKDRDWE